MRCVLVTALLSALSISGVEQLRAQEVEPSNVRPYATVSAGYLDWGKGSPCRCESFLPAVSFGVKLSGHLALGLRLDRVRTLRGGGWWLGPELSFAFLKEERLQLVAAWRGSLRKDIRDEFQSQRFSGYGAAYEFRYRPFKAPFHLSVGHRSLTDRTSVRQDGNLTSRTRTTHVGWQNGIGYQL